MLCSVSATWATLITDDFNRADTVSSTDTSLIGADWAQSAGSPNRWRIGSNTVYSLAAETPSVMYNTAQQTQNGGGGSFSLSSDVAGLASNVWLGIAFNYNNPSNFYTVRFKSGADDYQVLGKRVDGSWNVIASEHAVSNFTVGGFYTITVSSDTAYAYDVSIREVGSGVLMASRTGLLDDEIISSGGYAGLYLDTLNPTEEYARFDNFSLESTSGNSVVVSDGFTRPDVDYTTNTTLIGTYWQQESTTNLWSIGGKKVYSSIKVAEAVMYNNELENISGNGTNFTFSLDLAGRHNAAIWAGVAFNYQDKDNFYALRFKNTTDNYQVLTRVNGAWQTIVSAGHASAAFVDSAYYRLTISSSNAYEFSYSMAKVSDGTVVASGNVVDPNHNFTRGYAGLYQSSKGGAHAQFDNFSLMIASPLAAGYAGWATGWGVDIGAETEDYDEDGLSNVYEYGLGGDPTDPADQGISAEFGIVAVGGTNGFGYIHPQLAALDSGLSYYLKLSTDLASGTWVDAGYAVAGTNVTGSAMNFVTNFTDTVDGQKFIRLIIE